MGNELADGVLAGRAAGGSGAGGAVAFCRLASVMAVAEDEQDRLGAGLSLREKQLQALGFAFGEDGSQKRAEFFAFEALAFAQGALRLEVGLCDCAA